MSGLSDLKSEDICASSGQHLISLSLQSTNRNLVNDEKHVIGILYVLHSLALLELIKKGNINWD